MLRSRLSWMAGLLFLAHALVLVGLRSWPSSSLWSNVLQLTLGALAIGAAYLAGRRSGPFGQGVWGFVSIALVVWTVAQGIITYYESFLRSSLQIRWPSDPLIFFWVVPLFMALFLDTLSGRRRRDLVQILDFSQIMILAIAAYEAYLHVPSQWAAAGHWMAKLGWDATNVRDAVLTGGLAARAFLAQSNLVRSLFRRLMAFFVFYQLADLVYHFVEETQNVTTGSPWDLLWSAPFVVAIAAASSWQRPDESELDPFNERSLKARRVLFVSSAFMPLPVLLVAVRVEKETPFLGASLVVASLLCSAARLLITQQRRDKSEEALRHNEKEFKEAQRLARIGSWEWDIKSDTFRWSDELYRIARRDPNLPPPRFSEFAEVYPAESWERLRPLVEDALQTGAPYVVEMERLHPDGTKKSFVARGEAIRDAEDRVVSLRGTVQDITDRKQAEAALQESEERFRGLSDASFEGVAFSDAGTVILANTRLVEMLGCTMEEMVGSSVSDWIAPESRELVMERVRAGSEGTYEHLLQRKDHSTFPVETRARHLAWKGKRVRVTAIRDISERKRAERMMRLLTEGTAAVVGSEFFSSLARHSSTALHAQYAFVAERLEEGKARMLANWAGEAVAENFEYDLKDTPCRNVLKGETCFYRENVQSLFPKDDGLTKMGVESYLGVPLFDTAGRVIGHLAVLDTKPMPEDPQAMAILEIFAARAGAELERKRALDAVQREKEFSEAVIDSLPGFVFVVNPKGEVIRWNRNAETILGYSHDELLATNPLDHIVEEDHELVASKWLEAFEQGSAMTEARVLTKEGKKVHFLLSAVRTGIGNNVYIIGTGIDITERKRAEEALQAEKAFSEAVIDSLPGAFFVNDPQGRMIRWNKNVEDIGYSSDELASMAPGALVAADDRALIAAAREKVLTEGSGTVEVNIVTKDGTRIPHFISAVRADIGGTTYLVGTGVNVTERKRAEVALRESERRYRELVDHANDLIYETDAYGRFTFVNPVATRIMGYSPQELIGRHYLELIRPDFRPEAERLYTQQYADEVLSTYFQFPVLAKDGKEVWLGQHVQLALKEDRTVGFRAIARDITTQKKAEDALVESEERFRQMAENSPDLFWLFDVEKQRLLYASPAFEKMWGRSVEELHANPAIWRDTVHPEDRDHILTDWETRATTMGSQNEFRIIRPDGSVRWVNGRTFPIRDQAGQIRRLGGIAYDVTERRQAEETLIKLKKAVDTSGEVVFMTDREGVITSVNPEFTHLYGYTEQDVVGKVTPRILKSGNTSNEEYEHMWKAVLEKRLYQREIINKTKDGRLVNIETSVSAILGDRGEIVGFLAIQRDIAERKKAELALKASQEMFSKAFHSSPEPMGIMALPDWKFLDVNKATCDLIGFTREEIIGHTGRELGLASVTGVSETLLESIMQGNFRNKELDLRVKSGANRTVLVSLEMVEIGGQTCILAQGRDVTEHRRAENALRASDRRYRDFISHSQEGVWRIELNKPFAIDLPPEEQLECVYKQAYIAECNDAMARMLGASSVETLIGKRLIDLLPSNDTGRLESIRSAASGGWQNRTIQFQGMDLKGRTRHMQRTEIPIIENGMLTRVWGMTRDVTDLHDAEEALRASEQRYRLLFERSVAGVLETTLDGRLLECNDAFARIQGYTSRDEILSANVGDFYLERADGTALVDLLKQQPIVMGQEFQTRRKDGTPIWMLVSASLVENDQGGATILATAFDITQWKELGEQLRQSQKMEAVGRLAGGVAHDFNNMLQIINGYSELVIDELPPQDPLRSHVHEIKNIVERAAGLTRQLLAFSRQQVLAPQVLDLNIAIANLSKMLRRLIGEDVELFVTEGRPLSRVKADPGQIDQVIMNLAVNARDAMPQGGKLTIETSNVEIDATYALAHFPMTPGRYVMIAVNDTGCGMDAETQARIFEPFFTTKDKGKGTGLGLATVYGIIKQSGGFIWVESEVGKGTTFKVFLPPAGEAPAIHERKADSAKIHGTETVLLVEDEEYVRSLVRRSLESKGYAVLEARNGQEALHVAKQHEGPIHLLITDVVMPGMSGRELSENLAPLRPDMKTLFMSGYTDDSILHHGILQSGGTLLQKPFTAEALASKVRQVLETA
jgi:two-component system, cell cycle sensor histidine kinase and response regulator CckA